MIIGESQSAYLNDFSSAIIKHKRLVWESITQHVSYPSKSSMYLNTQESHHAWIWSLITYVSIEFSKKEMRRRVPG